MGNLLLATPMLRTLRDMKPEARISVLTWERGADIIQGMPWIDDVITHAHEHFVRSIGGLDYLLLSPVAHLRYPLVFANSKKIIEIPGREGPWIKSEASYNLDLLKEFGYDTSSPCQYGPFCYINEWHIDQAINAIKPIKPQSYIAIAAGYLRSDHWSLKHFGNDNYRQLIKQLIKNYNIVLVGSEEDRKDADFILATGETNNLRLNLCGRLDIKTSAAVIAGAKAIIGNDGGLLHVAACFDLPTVAIWTFTSLIKNMPLNPNLILAAEQCNKRTICQHGWFAKCEYEQKCRKISVEKVLNKFNQLIEKCYG